MTSQPKVITDLYFFLLLFQITDCPTKMGRFDEIRRRTQELPQDFDKQCHYVGNSCPDYIAKGTFVNCFIFVT
jgi:hypothetical protein